MLQFSGAQLQEIIAHCQDGYPDECCGALLGFVLGDRRAVEEARALANIQVERLRDRYEIAPRDLLALDRRARETGLETIGFYHSHPDHPDRPSSTDAERAWPSYSYLIVSVRDGRAAGWRSWRLEEEPRRFVEEPIRTDPPAG